MALQSLELLLTPLVTVVSMFVGSAAKGTLSYTVCSKNIDSCSHNHQQTILYL